MRRLLASERDGELYAKRRGMIEPVFADTAEALAALHGPDARLTVGTAGREHFRASDNG